MSEILVNTIKKADGTGSITVPAETGTVLTSATALSSFPSGFANGVTEYDQWRLSANIESTGSTNIDVTTNWERNDTLFEYIGTGMSQSGGIFTFPSTGKWLISYNFNFFSGSDSYYIGLRPFVSTDSGGNYTKRGETYTQNVTGGATKYAGASGELALDVTNTSTFRFFMNVEHYATINIMGNTNEQRSGLTFIRLGNT